MNKKKGGGRDGCVFVVLRVIVVYGAVSESKVLSEEGFVNTPQSYQLLEGIIRG